jgi:hypothetical protein
MASIKETKDLLVFVSRLGNSIDKTLADGKVSVTDTQYLFDPLFAAGAAFTGFADIPAEIDDLDDAEAMELVSVVANELDLSNDAAEHLSEEGLALAIAIVQFVNKIRAAKNA